MEIAPLKSFAIRARTDLLKEVGARLDVVLAPGSSARLENAKQVATIENLVARGGRDAIIERVAYTWFNRIVALRFMDANGYTGVGVVSPEAGLDGGQPEVLANAKAGTYDISIVPDKVVAQVSALIAGSRPSPDPQGEAYGLLLEAYCHHWHKHMDFMFEKEADYTELLVPASLLSADSVRDRAVKVLTKDVCQDVEVIGWLYQFYISERKDEVFAGFKKNKKAGADEIPAATQLFTPHWIVRYLVENSLGRLWMLNHPNSGLVSRMDYYLAPVDEEIDFLKITKPEDLKIIDPACGSGHMLTYAFDLLYAIYEEEGYSPADIPGLIITHNLYGTEIDGRAGSLAAFALTMKARAKQRTFFNKEVEPNICVIEPISFTQDELSYLVTKDGDRHAEEMFWNQFAEADTFGSLIQPDPDLTARLAHHLETLDGGGDMFLSEQTMPKAFRVILQAEYLCPRYSAVVANPPYMSSRNMSTRLKSFAASNFKTVRNDLFAMFIERCMLLAVGRGGAVAMVTMQSWMFLAAFEEWRTTLAARARITSMAHLGTRAFDSIGGEVVATTAFVLGLGAMPEQRARYVRLVDGTSEAEKSSQLKLVAQGQDSAYEVSSRHFERIPGNPIAYWVPESFSEIFGSTSVGDIADYTGSRNVTSENERFVRLWYEVSLQDLGNRWRLYAKGGQFRKYFGNLLSVVDWSDEARSYYAAAPTGNLLPRRFWFRSGLTYTDLTNRGFAARFLPVGCIYDMAGPTLHFDEASLHGIIAYMNTPAVNFTLSVLNPTIHCQIRDVASVPLPASVDMLAEVGRELVEIAKQDWDFFETSSEFMSSPMVGFGRLCDRIQDWVATTRRWADRALELELASHEVAEQALALGSELTGVPSIGGVTLATNMQFAMPNASAERRASAQVEGFVSDLVSYAVGCMFGRYSLDSPGLILADQGATLQDYLARVPSPTFTPDADNVIPIVDGEWFEDDIVERFRVFLKVAFGEEHFEENLAFVTESLGVKHLRDYFVKSFYKDHIQRYKKRPIYWLFSSPNGSFNALIYLHRYAPTTVSTVLNEYLRAYQTKLEVRLVFLESQITGGGNAKEIAQASKEAEKIRLILVELKDYETDLFQLAQQQIALDLDDGVKVNYSKFGKVLKDVGINKGGGDD